MPLTYRISRTLWLPYLLVFYVTRLARSPSLDLDMTDQPPHTTTVIIVGAGIAGLTLANCLDRAGISFVVLEAYHEVAPSVGASVGLLPTGLLILDQLGVYEHIRDGTVPCTRSYHRDAIGRVLLDSTAFDGFGSR